MRPRLAAVVLLALAGLLLAACREGRAPAATRAGPTPPAAGLPTVAAPPTRWALTVEPGRMAAGYEAFTGVERRRPLLALGQYLVVDYEATVRRGSLTLRVLDPEAEELWQTVLAQDGSGQVEVLCVLAGTYSIVVEARDSSGSFDIRYHTY